jgi:CBS domain-containing protein
MKVRDIMTQPPRTCRRETSLAVASRQMRALGCGTLAVLDSNGRLAGIVTDRDLAMAVGDTTRDPSRVAVDKAMTHRVHTCRPEDDLHAALARMTQARVRRLPVVDSDGDLKGIISIDDIALWGVQHGGVGLHEFTSALRSVCAPRTVALEASSPPL